MAGSDSGIPLIKISLAAFTLVFVMAGIYYFLNYDRSPLNPNIYIRTEKNYGEEIDQLAEEFDISPAYLKALVVLECSGRKEIEPRFEKHVYERLKKVQNGELENFEAVTQQLIHDASDDALVNLASSWGPFQLMGHKCLLLDIKIKDLRGPEALKWGVQWIDMTYGKRLEKSQYQDAFHIHNTGQSFPADGIARTHDPEYVSKGLSYMKKFEAISKKKAL
ncbi:MAG: hypothetical protein KJO64_09710 [Bacteroidia bacterium]|nr:hypothetical protein [Bacteroidia bacterium]